MREGQVTVRTKEQVNDDVLLYGTGFLVYDVATDKYKRVDPRNVVIYRFPNPAADAAGASPIATSPEALRGHRRGQQGQGGPAAALGAERPGEDHGEPPVMPWSGALPDGGAALLSAVANLLLEFDSLEGTHGDRAMRMQRSWGRHRRRLLDALTGSEDTGIADPLSDDGEARVEIIAGVAVLFIIAWLAWKVATL